MGPFRRGLPSLYRHCRHFAGALFPSVFHASAFLPPFPRRGFALPRFSSRRFRALGRVRSPSSRARFPAASPWLALPPCGTTKALTAATVTSIAALLAYLTHTSRRSASNHVGEPNIALSANCSVSDAFQASPSPRQLALTPRRIEFVFLRTASSPPVALHPASQRRSYLRLRSLGLLRHGLSPCCVRAFTSALGGAPSPRQAPCATTYRPEGGPPTTPLNIDRPGGGPPTTTLWERRPRRELCAD